LRDLQGQKVTKGKELSPRSSQDSIFLIHTNLTWLSIIQNSLYYDNWAELARALFPLFSGYIS
jgi:hypothetical protein